VQDVPPSFTLLKVAGPDLSIEEVSLARLPGDWVGASAIPRPIGTEWLRSHRSALLQVPRAFEPETANILLNPLDPDASEFRIEHSYEYPFDLRLKSGRRCRT
jgi:hypothetical protein